MAANAQPPGLDLGQELEVRVAQARGSLSRNDERILAFVRERLAQLAFHTAESLAQGAGVSPAAIVRFARRLGFASFRELRDRARADLQSGQDGGGSSLVPETTLSQKVQRDVASLELLPRMLEGAFEPAATAIAGARTTWFLANRETYGIAVYAQRLLHHVRSNVRLVDPSFPDPLRDVAADDVLVACTFRPYARATLELLPLARRAGVAVVLVTDGRGHDFVEPGDIVLAVPVESPTLLLSFTPAVCVLEALAARVALLDADQTHDTLAATARFLADQRLVMDRGAPAAVARAGKAPGPGGPGITSRDGV